MPESKTPIGRGSIGWILRRAPLHPFSRANRLYPVVVAKAWSRVSPPRSCSPSATRRGRRTLAAGRRDPDGRRRPDRGHALPAERRRPAGGWPAVVLVHGFGGNREQVNALATAYGLVERDYVVLTVDARGHGQSGGLVSARRAARSRGPARRARVARRARGRRGHADRRLGDLVRRRRRPELARRGRPVGAPPSTFESWTDLLTALDAAGAREVGRRRRARGLDPGERRDPSLAPVLAAAFAGTSRPSSRGPPSARASSRLGLVTAPVFIAQGRRDFLFGIDQGDDGVPAPARPEDALRRPSRPRAVDVPGRGHARAPDAVTSLARLPPPRASAARRARRASRSRRSVSRARSCARRALPQTRRRAASALPRRDDVRAEGKAVRRSAPLRERDRAVRRAAGEGRRSPRAAAGRGSSRC